MNKMLGLINGVVGALLLTGFAANAQQRPADYPSKPLRIYVASAPGGGVDIIVRIVAQKLTERWGANTVVDNVAGGVGLIALERMLQAPPDGHTFISSGAAIEMHNVYKRFDILRALAPVAQMTTQPYLLVVTSSLPVSTVKEYAAYAKTRSGQINYASSGMGSIGHLGHAMFNAALGISTNHIPYKGAGSAMADLASERANGLGIRCSGLRNEQWLRDLYQYKGAASHCDGHESGGPGDHAFARVEVKAGGRWSRGRSSAYPPGTS
jgi:tripartite-type tricarboxylate transporter receptor subunit TctC